MCSVEHTERFTEQVWIMYGLYPKYILIDGWISLGKFSIILKKNIFVDVIKQFKKAFTSYVEKIVFTSTLRMELSPSRFPMEQLTRKFIDIHSDVQVLDPSDIKVLYVSYTKILPLCFTWIRANISSFTWIRIAMCPWHPLRSGKDNQQGHSAICL